MEFVRPITGNWQGLQLVNRLWYHLRHTRLIRATEYDLNTSILRSIQGLAEQIQEENTCEACGENWLICECTLCPLCSPTVRQISSCDHCAKCPIHCNCEHCNSCDQAVGATCSNCGNCSSCCRCYACDYCGESVFGDDYCSGCDRCNSCCICSETGPRQGYTFRFPTVNRKEFRHNKLTRCIGTELELAGMSNAVPLKRWARETNSGLVADGSLPPAGVEVVINPRCGDSLDAVYTTLGETLANARAFVDSSCGLHMHVDARDFTQSDLRRMLLLYCATEQTLFELVSHKRFNYQYAEACGHLYLRFLQDSVLQNAAHKPTERKQWSAIWRQSLASRMYGHQLSRNVNGSVIKHLKADRYNGRRYHALNIQSYFVRRSFEFRLHEGTLDKTVIYHWALICGWLVEFALKTSEANLYKLVHSSAVGEQILRSILPTPIFDYAVDRLQRRRIARFRSDRDDTFLKNLSSPVTVQRLDVFQTSLAKKGGN